MKKLYAFLFAALFSANAYAGINVLPTPNAVGSTGTFTSGHCAQFSDSGTSGATISDAGAACGSGGGGGSPGGTLGQVQYNAGPTTFGGFTFSGDCTFDYTTGIITCTKTSGNAFAASATTDTTNAANISSGTLPAGRLPNPSASTLGGVESIAAVSNNFLTSISTSGVPAQARPTCGNLSDSSTGCSTTVGSLATLNTVNNGNWSGTALSIGNGGTGQTSASTAFNALSPLTTSGDVLYGAASGAGTRLAANATATNKYLQSVSSGIPAWAQVAFGDLSGQATNAQLATQSANTLLGALTATTPSGISVPSCTDTSGNHLNWTSGTGFSCGTTDSHVGTVTSVATTSPITGGTITTSGTIACATCATTTNGGAISGTAPVAVSAAGAISVTGAANQVLAGSGPAFTATPTIGTSVTTPLVIGGTTASSTLTLESTSGTGTTDSIVMKTGSQATAMTIASSGTTTIAAAGIDAQSTPAISTATFTPNFAAANHFIINLVHASCPCTLANPTNIVAGQSGVIAIVQSATGSDTITSYGADFIFTNSSAPTLSTAANSIDYLSYYVEDSTHIRAAFIPASPQSVNTGGFISNQTKFTTSGCSVSATTGGATAGKYTSGTTGTCTVVVTMNGATGLTAPNGWSCWANDETTTADKQQTTSSTTTTATIAGTTVTGDVIDFGCLGF